MILDKNLAEVLPLDLADPDQIQEEVAHSWYKYPDGKNGAASLGGRHRGRTTPVRSRPTSSSTRTASYSWLKAPRWKGNAMEVGPLARMLVGFASGKPEFKEVVDEALGRLKVPAAALVLDAGPHGRAGLETQLAVALAAGRVRPPDRQSEERRHGHRRHTRLGSRHLARGSRASASPKLRAARCATGSRSTTAKSPTTRSWCPSTWNASPKDGKGQHGAYEAALIGTPMADPQRPVEILRTIHSFDPCLACASHVIGPDGAKLAEVVVR